jgi:Hemerythrin HHE cation binding domain
MSQPLPSLFGRFTAIYQDHDQLAKTLRRLRTMCAALEDGQAHLPADLLPTALLGQLRADLTAHFQVEESGAYFGVVVEEEPRLAPQIAGLKWEHLTMLHAVDVLCELAKDRERWLHLPAPTRELVAELTRHELAESRLLRALFSAPP